MAENPTPSPLSSTPVFFWTLMTLVLAIVMAALWVTIVTVVIPFVTAVMKAYF